ncbi:MAG: transposase [Acutalibacteraceae bacterium]
MAKEGYKKRLDGFNYSNGGAYFLTACTENAQKLLGEIERGANGVPDVAAEEKAQVRLSEYGKILDRVICSFNTVYFNPRIVKYVIMPNHFHLLVVINPDLLPEVTATSGTPSPQNATIPFVMSTIKRFFHRETGKNIWERSYRDHIIRTQEDYKKISRYIEENPSTWEKDCYYVR